MKKWVCSVCGYVYEGETYDWYSGSVFKTLHCLDGDITYE